MTDSQTPPPPPPVGDASETKKVHSDEQLWALFCHLSSLAGYVLTVPFAGVIGPLVIWLIKKDEFPLVDDQGKEAINFQISMAIYTLISAILVFVIIGFFLLLAVILVNLICVILASVKAYEGQRYRYPLCIRFLR